MPLSIRIPPEKMEIIEREAEARGQTKTAFILEALDEKLGLVKTRSKLIREFAGWMSPEEAEELNQHTAVLREINEGDWP